MTQAKVQRSPSGDVLTASRHCCRKWSEACCSKDSDYFSKWATSQSPEYFYIGCADSRVSVRRYPAALPHAELTPLIGRLAPFMIGSWIQSIHGRGCSAHSNDKRDLSISEQVLLDCTE